MPSVIPEPLVNSLLNDQVVLFLGSGASKGAKDKNGKEPPVGNQLKEAICDKFLDGNLKDRALAEICDYVVNEYDLITLQTFISDKFLDYQPADFHLLIPLFPWHAIATTNYDLIVERSYQSAEKRIKEIEPFVKNGQKINIKLKKNHNTISYIKLHGCISHASDTTIPLILTNEQYSKHRNNRDRLFERLKDLGRQCSIVFCGYSISDYNIRDILFDFTDIGIERPRYYLVKPNIDDYENRYWSKHRFTLIQSNFGDFLSTLLSRTSEHGRTLATLSAPGATSLSNFYRTNHPKESPALLKYLAHDVTHVRIGMPITGDTPKNFYSGYDKGWWAIEQGLDVYRDFIDSLIVDAILNPTEKKTSVELFVIKGPAGNGKTVALKRAAWDSANDYEQLALYLNEGGSLNKECVQEIYDLTGKRQIYFVDHVALLVDDVVSLMDFCKTREIPITVIATERDNEWNVRCESLEPFLSNDFAVSYLSTKEIKQLLEKLEANKCLGELEHKTPEARFAAFSQRAQRQLLVALHEVTLGRPFEQIIKDEYDRILPDEAKFLYLDICTLNRLAVPVRAGLIARISKVTFEKFEKELFHPLEHLVKTHKHPYLQDYLYEARHPYVAELVFSQAFTKPEDRFEQIIRLLRGINIDYSSDHDAFYSIIKGRNISDVFPSIELGRKLFSVAHEVAKVSPYVHQQEALFEMSHSGGSLARAQRAIEKAHELAHWDLTIQHTMANIKRRMANEARTPLERDKFRKDARDILDAVIDGDSEQPHGLYTYAQVLTDELEDLLKNNSADSTEAAEDRRIAELMKLLERCRDNANQKFPNHEQMLVQEARLHTLLEQHSKAERALQRAFNANPRNEYIAARLTENHIKANRISDAKSTLAKCLEQNPSSRIVHFRMARFLMKHGTQQERPLIVDHLRKSFFDGDGNYDAQFWYGRELFILGKYQESKIVFDRMSRMPIAYALRSQVRGHIKDDSGTPRRFVGDLVRFESGYGFIKTLHFPENIYAPSSDSDQNAWAQLHRFGKVSFEIAFTMRGPRATNLYPS